MNCNLFYNSLFTVYNSLFGPNRASSRPNVVVPRSTTSSPRQLHTEFGPNIRQTSIPAGPHSFMFSRFTIQNFRLQFDPPLHRCPLNKIDNKYDTILSFWWWTTKCPRKPYTKFGQDIQRLYYIYHLCFTCIDFYDLSAWDGCWFVVCIRRFIYKFLNVCPVAGSGNVGPVNKVNHTSWVAVVTTTDRPKSVRNRYVIELFCGVVCVVTLPLWHFCWYMGFCHRTESDLFLFLLL